MKSEQSLVTTVGAVQKAFKQGSSEVKDVLKILYPGAFEKDLVWSVGDVWQNEDYQVLIVNAPHSTTLYSLCVVNLHQPLHNGTMPRISCTDRKIEEREVGEYLEEGKFRRLGYLTEFFHPRA